MMQRGQKDRSSIKYGVVVPRKKWPSKIGAHIFIDIIVVFFTINSHADNFF